MIELLESFESFGTFAYSQAMKTEAPAEADYIIDDFSDDQLPELIPASEAPIPASPPTSV